MRSCRFLFLLIVFVLPISVPAEDGYAAWLRYARIEDKAAVAQYESLPACVVVYGDSVVTQAARQELILGVRGMLGRTLRLGATAAGEDEIILTTMDSAPSLISSTINAAALQKDGYVLHSLHAGDRSHVVVASQNDRGVLYGVFALLRMIAMGRPVDHLDVISNTYAPVRMLNHWDNLDGSIERGYAGRSIFFSDGSVRTDLTRVGDYARMMASVGIDACSINNVNADPKVITPEFVPQLARVANEFRPWGVRLFVSVDFSSPQKIGGLDTFDPLDQRVVQFWKATVDRIYHAIPDFGGFVLKADSEGRLGPSAYGRTHADAANVIARALAPHGGLIFYRGFVYDHHMDWTNLKNDRASAAVNNFRGLDGKFEPNAIVQIKYGPIDFQVREPPSPLFGILKDTDEAIELQITQEYTGQQRHLCYLVPMWKEVLDFDLQANGPGTPVKDLASERTFHRPAGGFVAVSNVGLDRNWLGHHLALANLYGFGRLAWDPNLTSKRIAEEWTVLTFGLNPKVVDTIVDMQLRSWPIYEKYTGPLGIGTLTDIIGVHYGPAPDSSERNGWGQWHRADEKGVGMDRTVATGTGFIGQYSSTVAAAFESLATCPDDLLLFMHHVPYTHVLHSGKTVIQYIYDSHYEGAEEAASLVDQWKSLKHLVDDERYGEVLGRLQYQAGHAIVWRDSVCNYFLKKSGIADIRGRVGHYPGRYEAEAMSLDGYQVIAVTPWEAASGGKAVVCPQSQCSAAMRFDGKPGWYDITVQYFDQNNGVSHFQLLISGQTVDEWSADDSLPADKPNSHSSTRHLTTGLALRPGDEIKITGIPDGGERAPLDYIEI
ncbi:MAG TPA: alpha-glucuronidase family glycosyl hydrolase, partial [Blastocatellia bacterium]